MPRYLFSILIFIALISCNTEDDKQFHDKFSHDLETLQSYFQIPGMAVLVKQGQEIIYEDYKGFANLEQQQPVDANTLFPIASVSKIFAASILFQLVEENKLDLKTPIRFYLPESSFPESVEVQHILSHTSQGTAGNGFVYSGRFGVLTQLIEKLEDKPYAKSLQERIISKIGLQNTIGFQQNKQVDTLRNRLASPYLPPQEKGFYDAGLSASTGIISSVRDLALFDDALKSGKIISSNSLKTMTSPFISNTGWPLPYGLGMFTQTFQGQSLLWGYGQNDCFSSLYLSVPEKDLTLIILANNNLMSDPARLIYGDVSYSLFALSFLEHFVFKWPKTLDFFDLTKKAEWITSLKGVLRQDYRDFYVQKLRATALAMSFMGQLNPQELERSKALINLKPFFAESTLKHDLSELHTLITFYENGVDDLHETIDIEKIANELNDKYPENPYPKVYLGFFYVKSQQNDVAATTFEALINIPNTSPNWYTLEALDYLGNYYEEKAPFQARIYYQKIVDIGWNYAGKVDKAKKKLKALEAV